MSHKKKHVFVNTSHFHYSNVDMSLNVLHAMCMWCVCHVMLCVRCIAQDTLAAKNLQPEPELEPEPALGLRVLDVCSSSESETEPAHDRRALDICSSSDSEPEPAHDRRPLDLDVCSSSESELEPAPENMDVT